MPQEIISQFNRNYNGPIETSRQVQSIAIRDAIITSKRWEGMQVYVVDDSANYELRGGVTNSNWELVTGLSEAPEDDGYYARRNGIWTPIETGGSFRANASAYTLSGSAAQNVFTCPIPGNTLIENGEGFEFYFFFTSTGANSNQVNFAGGLTGSGINLAVFDSAAGSLNYILKGHIIKNAAGTYVLSMDAIATNTNEPRITVFNDTILIGTWADAQEFFIEARDASGSNTLTLLGGYIKKI